MTVAVFSLVPELLLGTLLDPREILLCADS